MIIQKYISSPTRLETQPIVPATLAKTHTEQRDEKTRLLDLVFLLLILVITL